MSSADIAVAQRCSESKVNYWIRKFNIQKRSVSEAVYLKHNPLGNPFKIKPIQSMADAQLLGLGLGLFWGEGTKKSKVSVRLGNTDPGLIREFIKFLIHICGAEPKKLKFWLQIFDDMPRKATLLFWLNSLKEFGIIKEQFSKVTVTPSRSIGTYREKSKHGVLSVYFHNTKLKQAIDQMIADVAQRQSNCMVSSRS